MRCIVQEGGQDGQDKMDRAMRVERAMRALKRKMQREGIFRKIKATRYYQKPSEIRAQKKKEAARRVRRMASKRAQNEV